MGPFQIIFILINLAVPYWIWSGDDTDKSGPSIEWQAWTKNMKRLVESTGKNTCRSSEMVDKIRGLCHQSEARLTPDETVVFERVIGNTLFSCTVHNDYLLVRFYPYDDSGTEDHEACTILDSHKRVQLEPEFLFTHKGFVNSISFNGGDGQRQSVPIKNCRMKLKKAKALKPKSLADFEKSLGQMQGDPADYLTANRFCLSYDLAADWQPLQSQLLNN